MKTAHRKTTSCDQLLGGSQVGMKAQIGRGGRSRGVFAAQHLQQPVSAHSTTAQFASQHSNHSQTMVLRVFAAHAPWQHVLLFGWQIYLAAMHAHRRRQSLNSPCTPAQHGHAARETHFVMQRTPAAPAAVHPVLTFALSKSL
jgi:hypothetical protein